MYILLKKKSVVLAFTLSGDGTVQVLSQFYTLVFE